MYNHTCYNVLISSVETNQVVLAFDVMILPEESEMFSMISRRAAMMKGRMSWFAPVFETHFKAKVLFVS